MKKYIGILVLIMLLTGCTNKNSDLNCIYIADDNSTFIENYTFKDGVVETYELKMTLPVELNNEPETYKDAYENYYNEVDGCEGSFEEKNGIYVSDVKCNLSIAPDEDIEKIFMVSKEKMRNTRKELVESYKSRIEGAERAGQDIDLVCNW